MNHFDIADRKTKKFIRFAVPQPLRRLNVASSDYIGRSTHLAQLCLIGQHWRVKVKKHLVLWAFETVHS
jgi:hypothetical protein